MAGLRRSLLLAGQCRDRGRRLAAAADLAACGAHQEHPRRPARVADARRAQGGRSAARRARHADGHGGRDRRSGRAPALSRPPAGGGDVRGLRAISRSTRSTLKGAHLVAGFGRIVDLKPDDLLTDLAGAEALVAAEPDILAHMNADHAEACRLYATKLLGAPDGDWRCVGCDPEGLELQTRPHRRCGCRSRSGARRRACCAQVLKQLAEQARAADLSATCCIVMRCLPRRQPIALRSVAHDQRHRPRCHAYRPWQALGS